MKKYTLILLALITSLSTLMADVTFTVNVPSGTPQCYLVGALPQLSSWSAGAAIPMKRVEDKDQFTITISGITHTDISTSEGYKYTCGPDWKYVEKTASGGEVTNRTTVGNPDIVASWAAIYENVGITENYTIASRQYPVQILLPSDYDPTRQYPVIYMLGRHQRYRDAGSDTEMGDRILYADSWGVAQTVNQLEQQGHPVGIIAVIYAQLPEFTPWHNDDFAGTGQAQTFLKSFVEDFMPAFEKKYTITPDKTARTITGADVAGLFALYATLEYPQLFGKCGLFSPSIWYNSPEMRAYASAYQKDLAGTEVVMVTTTGDIPITTDEVTYYSAWTASRGAQVRQIEIPGPHDDRTWGKAVSTVINSPTTIATTKERLNHTAQQTHAEAAIDDYSAVTWYFMKGEGTTTLTCEGTATQKGSFYRDGKTPTTAQLLVKEIPVDSKKYSYYWNLNSGSACDGELLLASPKDIGFKNTRSTTAWQRVAVFADGTYEQAAASANHFTANGVKMTIAAQYQLQAELTLTDSKQISIHYGSVNSGSDMGELVSTTVSDNCLKAQVRYSYLTNQLSVTETAWGSSDISLDYFRVEPAVVRPGTPVRMSVKISDKNGYKVSYRMNHNNQSSSAITLTPGSDGEEYYIISNPQTGIYGFYLDIELNGTLTKAHRMVLVKVVDGHEIQPVIHENPYAEIDWNSVNHYKSNLHTHTTQSNDAIDEFSTAHVVDLYHAAGYQILALTDHDYNPYPWQLFPQYMSGIEARDPDTMGMLAVPGNERSTDNTNSWSERTGGV